MTIENRLCKIFGHKFDFVNRETHYDNGRHPHFVEECKRCNGRRRHDFLWDVTGQVWYGKRSEDPVTGNDVNASRRISCKVCHNKFDESTDETCQLFHFGTCHDCESKNHK